MGRHNKEDEKFIKCVGSVGDATRYSDLKSLDEKTLRDGIRDLKIVIAKLEHQLAIRNVQGRGGK